MKTPQDIKVFPRLVKLNNLIFTNNWNPFLNWYFIFLKSTDYEPSLPVSEKSNPVTRDIDRASANSIVRMLHTCDSQMFQEETGGAYQVLGVHKQPSTFRFLQQNYHFFVLPVISLEASEWTNGENIGGGCAEGGAHSQGINALPVPPAHFCRSFRRVVKVYLLTGSSGQSHHTERMRDFWSNGIPHHGTWAQVRWRAMTAG